MGKACKERSLIHERYPPEEKPNEIIHSEVDGEINHHLENFYCGSTRSSYLSILLTVPKGFRAKSDSRERTSVDIE